MQSLRNARTSSSKKRLRIASNQLPDQQLLIASHKHKGLNCESRSHHQQRTTANLINQTQRTQLRIAYKSVDSFRPQCSIANPVYGFTSNRESSRMTFHHNFPSLARLAGTSLLYSPSFIRNLRGCGGVHHRLKPPASISQF